MEGGEAVFFITQSRQEGVEGMEAFVSEEKSCKQDSGIYGTPRQKGKR